MSTITEHASGTATIGSTEWSLTNNSSTKATNTTNGAVQVVLDLSALANGDVFELYIWEKVVSGGSQKRLRRVTYTGVQPDEGDVTPSVMLKHGWDFTLKKISGTDRSITWSIRLV